MKLKKCLKCYSESYENLASYSICHDCNYNSIEGYVWGKEHDLGFYRQMNIRRLRLPVDEDDTNRFIQSFVAPYPFSRNDQWIVNEAMGKLLPFEVTLLYFRFWLGLSTESIAELIGLTAWKVELTLIQTYSRLKESCLDDPTFSVNQSTQEIENGLMSKAA